MIINLLTIFPDYFTSPLNCSIVGRAKEQGLIELNIIDIRDFSFDKHQTTDLPPYGGGAGMVMKVGPIDRALKKHHIAKGQDNSRVVLTSAKGSMFKQAMAQQWSQLKQLTIICGHYAGVDERVAAHLVDAEVRVGNYVLTGGEPAALVISDAVTRLLPGVLGNPQSLDDESHSQPKLGSYPQYTRPETYKQWPVPEVLLSGDHQKIKHWREEQKTELE